MIYARWYEWALNIKSLYRWVCTATVVLIVFLSWLTFLFFPLKKQMEQASLDLKQRKIDISLCASHEDTCRKLSNQITQMQKDVGLDSVFSSNYLQCNIDQTVALIERLGLHLVSLKKESEQEKGWYKTVRVSLEASGLLSAMMLFFQALKDNEQLVQCNQIHIQRNDERQYGLHCQLNFFVPLNTISSS